MSTTRTEKANRRRTWCPEKRNKTGRKQVKAKSVPTVEKKIRRAYRFELAPTKKQVSRLKQCAGTARYTWNWALSHRIRLWQRARITLNHMDQHKILVRLKQTKFSWMYEVSKAVPEAARNLKIYGLEYLKRQEQNEDFVAPGLGETENASGDGIRLSDADCREGIHDEAGTELQPTPIEGD